MTALSYTQLTGKEKASTIVLLPCFLSCTGTANLKSVQGAGNINLVSIANNTQKHKGS